MILNKNHFPLGDRCNPAVGSSAHTNLRQHVKEYKIAMNPYLKTLDFTDTTWSAVTSRSSPMTQSLYTQYNSNVTGGRNGSLGRSAPTVLTGVDRATYQLSAIIHAVVCWSCGSSDGDRKRWFAQ